MTVPFSSVGSARSLRMGPPWLSIVMAAVLIVVAIRPGLATTKHLNAPYDPDAFRDIAAAQSIRDGVWGDPFYAGESAWYNPLAPALIAAASRLLDLPVSVTDVRVGAWITIAAPVAFFVSTWWLISAEAGLLALTAFLFLPTDAPAWAAGTYTPWFFPALLAQTFLYLGLIACAMTLRRHTRAMAIVCGGLIGVTFLAHTAAALMLAGTLVVSSTWQVVRKEIAISRAIRSVAIAAIVSMVVSSPFLVPLVIRYRLHVVNVAPATWVYDAGFPRALMATLRNPAVWLLLTTAAVGAWSLLRRYTVSTAVILGWGVVSAAMSIYSLAVGAVPWLPPIVPAYHFEFQVRAWGWILFGAGLATLVHHTFSLVSAPKWSATASCAALSVAMAALLYPAYRHRPAFTEAAAVAQRIGASPERSITSWLRTSTPADAIVLASDDDGLMVVAPAGRRVVAVDPFFSNPYVPYTTRRQARDRMFAALVGGDTNTFDALAREYHVTHVLARGHQAGALLDTDRLQPVLGASDLSLFRVGGQ